VFGTLPRRFSASEKYFNAGVFVADLEKWRALDMSAEMGKWMMLNADKNIYQVDLPICQNNLHIYKVYLPICPPR
jgi:lipopolysaccharide biosynthesis glycosyltransferase